MAHVVSDDLRQMLALQLTPGLGPRLTAALLERFGTAERIRQASADQLAEVPMIGTNLGANLPRHCARSMLTLRWPASRAPAYSCWLLARRIIHQCWLPLRMRRRFCTCAGR